MSYEDVILAFVGTIVPDKPRFRNRAFSRAGNMFQENLLDAISAAGLSPSLILSQRPLRAYPGSSRLFVPGENLCLRGGHGVTLLPFINVLVLRVLTVGLAVVWGLIQWAWKNRRSKHKVVLVYNLTEPSGVFVWLGAKLIGAKAVVALCDINIPGRTVDDTLARRIDFRVQQWIVPWFDGLLVVNRKIVEDFAPKTPFTWVVGGGTEAFLETPVVNDVRFEEQDSRFVIAFAGMLTEVNGIPELLDAFSSLEDGKTAYRLRIAGKGTLEPLVREAVAHDPRIDFLGYVPFEKIVELYSMADVLINMRITQRIKTDYFFPSKLLEYMSTGIPTITTAVGHAEQFADCVFMVHEETAQALADKMRYIASLDREQRKLMGEKARAYIQENLTWEIQGQRVVEFIKTKIIDE